LINYIGRTLMLNCWKVCHVCECSTFEITNLHLCQKRYQHSICWCDWILPTIV